MKRITVDLSEELYERLRAYAFHSKLKMVDVVRAFLETYLPKEAQNDPPS